MISINNILISDDEVKRALNIKDFRNLSKDKIMEFAKSEQFGTYKRLFNELGLS